MANSRCWIGVFFESPLPDSLSPQWGSLQDYCSFLRGFAHSMVEGPGPFWALVPKSWPCLAKPLSIGLDEVSRIMQTARANTQPHEVLPGSARNRKLYWWMELFLLFLIELNSTLGHFSLSIKKVSADGTITPTPVSPASFWGWYLLLLTNPPPPGTEAPTWFCFTMLQFLSLPEDDDSPDKRHCFYPAIMNKQALCFILGQGDWLNESENSKKDCLPSVYQLLDDYSGASCKENRWRMSA